MKKIKMLIFPISFSVLLIGCSNKELNGDWRLADNDNNCPVSYQFDKKIEVNPETKKKKTMWLIEMHTQKISKEYKNSGTYTWLDSEWINIDYGNNFTQKQKMVQDKDKLTAYFPVVDKVCTYKR
ncbi:hypothetical protein CN285_25555 [Bacillus cereus]|uniref:hypothetical protein n=1 Tax=Bacillus paramycoides TaxID=2026194 RepID=UPI000BF2E00B|nr:hypothetical protein [Bacillus paramycoides]PFD34395.1 hypothetical protein CN285_25555 [Bacillus cereus]PGM53362.1 hypothetical protein CN947_26085 [Bacillus cereus]